MMEPGWEVRLKRLWLQEEKNSYKKSITILIIGILFLYEKI